MARSRWKGEFVDLVTWRCLQSQLRRSVFVTWSRNCTVTQELLGQELRIHWGKEFAGVVVQPEQVGYKLGSLAITKAVGSSIHKFNRLAQKKKKSDELLRQRKARKQNVKSRKKGGKKSLKRGGVKKK